MRHSARRAAERRYSKNHKGRQHFVLPSLDRFAVKTGRTGAIYAVHPDRLPVRLALISAGRPFTT